MKEKFICAVIADFSFVFLLTNSPLFSPGFEACCIKHYFLIFINKFDNMYYNLLSSSSTHSPTTVGAYRCFPHNQLSLLPVSRFLHNFTDLQLCPFFDVVYPLFLWSASSSFSLCHPFHRDVGTGGALGARAPKIFQ